MTDIDEHGRPEPPFAADETDTLTGFLDYQRATLGWKCEGLDAAGLDAKVGVSSMTLGGMLKHMALVEESWFSERLWANEAGPPWDAVDWEADRDWEWHTAPHDTPEELRQLWQSAVDTSRSPGGGRSCGRRARPAGAQALQGRQGAQPALDPRAHDRGVRPP